VLNHPLDCGVADNSDTQGIRDHDGCLEHTAFFNPVRTRHVPVAVARVEGREDWLARNLSSRQDRRYAGADRPFPHDVPALTRDQRRVSDLDPTQ